jgi:hypothetical protein
MAIVARYKGTDGAHFHGIPAADMTEEEFASLTDEQKATVAASPLYSLRGEASADADQAAHRVARASAAETGPTEKK